MSYFVLPFQERVGQYKVKCVLHNENVKLFSNSFSACTGEIVFLSGRTLTDILRDRLMVLRMCMVGMKLAKEMLREEDYSSFLMKSSCAW